MTICEKMLDQIRLWEKASKNTDSSHLKNQYMHYINCTHEWIKLLTVGEAARVVDTEELMMDTNDSLLDIETSIEKL
jgi:metal-dependent HD superfamily phosphatase/phosphodiesterase